MGSAEGLKKGNGRGKKTAPGVTSADRNEEPTEHRIGRRRTHRHGAAPAGASSGTEKKHGGASIAFAGRSPFAQQDLRRDAGRGGRVVQGLARRGGRLSRPQRRRQV